MSYIKVIDNGHVIEVYEMENEPFHDTKKRNDDHDPFERHLTYLYGDDEQVQDENRKQYMKEWHERVEREYQRGSRVEERKLQTLRDAKNTLRRLAVANFTSNDLFITLTYSENFDDVTEGDKHFSKFIRALRKNQKQKFSYIAVREFQKRGALHYHIMCDLKIDGLNFKSKKDVQFWENYIGGIWGYGFVDIQKMDRHNSKDEKYKNKPIDNVGAYLSKYFQKSMSDKRLEGKKVYLTSKGLVRPKIYKNDEAVEFLKNNKIWQKKETFTNGYESEYLGKIVYKEYNLKRM